MFIKKFNLKLTVLALSLLALATNSQIFASAEHSSSHSHHSHSHHGEGVIPAQANYQDETPFDPVADEPISFSVRNFRNNVEVNRNKSVFEVEIPGLYSIDAFLVLSIPNIGETVAGYITINERKLLTFFETATRTDSPIVGFHFNDRLVYLKKGDKVSVVVSDFPQGTAVLARGFVMVALNNSR